MSFMYRNIKSFSKSNLGTQDIKIKNCKYYISWAILCNRINIISVILTT